MSQEWYVFKDGQQKGPFTREQLVQQAGSSTLGPADMVWTGGMAGWTRADQVEGLFPPAPAAPPPPAPAAPPPPGASPYQQGYGGAGFPGAPAGKQGKGLVIALAIILVGVIAIGGYFVFFANGNGETAADPDTPAPTAPAPDPDSVPSAPAATGADALLGEWKVEDPVGALYYGFYQDGELVFVDYHDELGGVFKRFMYRLKDLDALPQSDRDVVIDFFGEEAEEYYYLYGREHATEKWRFVSEIFRVLPSGAVMMIHGDKEYELQRIDRQELEEVLDISEDIT